MVEFDGFEVDKWGRYVQIHEENTSLFEEVEDQLAQFIEEFRELIRQHVKDRVSPYDKFQQEVHGRGRNFQFWFQGKRGSPGYDYYVGLRISPEDGWIETSISADRSSDSKRLLRNLDGRKIRRLFDGWSIYYEKGWEERVVGIDKYTEVLDLGPASTALILRRYVSENSSSFGNGRIKRRIADDLKSACEIFGLLS